MQLVSLGLIITGAFLWWRGLKKGASIPSVSAARTTVAR
jgi:hypothetical protein